MRAFDYALLRVVPDVAREEFLNVGAVLFSHGYDFLAARLALDEARLRAFSPGVDVALVRAHLEEITRLAAGGPSTGPLGLLSAKERFHWLVAPRSTIVQTSPPHTGLCTDPERMLQHILARMVSTDYKAG